MKTMRRFNADRCWRGISFRRARDDHKDKTTMSTRADRAFRANRCILPIKVRVRQTDGSRTVQVVDACVRVRSPHRRTRSDASKGRNLRD